MLVYLHFVVVEVFRETVLYALQLAVTNLLLGYVSRFIDIPTSSTQTEYQPFTSEDMCMRKLLKLSLENCAHSFSKKSL